MVTPMLGLSSPEALTLEEVFEETAGFPRNSVGEESACTSGDTGLILGLRRSPGEGKGNPLQYSCLENPMDRGAWRASVHAVTRVGHDLATKPPLPPPGPTLGTESVPP